jgi:hypothetical protein
MQVIDSAIKSWTNTEITLQMGGAVPDRYNLPAVLVKPEDAQQFNNCGCKKASDMVFDIRTTYGKTVSQSVQFYATGREKNNFYDIGGFYFYQGNQGRYVFGEAGVAQDWKFGLMDLFSVAVSGLNLTLQATPGTLSQSTFTLDGQEKTFNFTPVDTTTPHEIAAYINNEKVISLWTQCCTGSFTNGQIQVQPNTTTPISTTFTLTNYKNVVNLFNGNNTGQPDPITNEEVTFELFENNGLFWEGNPGTPIVTTTATTNAQGVATFTFLPPTAEGDYFARVVHQGQTDQRSFLQLRVYDACCMVQRQSNYFALQGMPNETLTIDGVVGYYNSNSGNSEFIRVANKPVQVTITSRAGQQLTSGTATSDADGNISFSFEAPDEPGSQEYIASFLLGEQQTNLSFYINVYVGAAWSSGGFGGTYATPNQNLSITATFGNPINSNSSTTFKAFANKQIQLGIFPSGTTDYSSPLSSSSAITDQYGDATFALTAPEAIGSYVIMALYNGKAIGGQGLTIQLYSYPTNLPSSVTAGEALTLLTKSYYNTNYDGTGNYPPAVDVPLELKILDKRGNTVLITTSAVTDENGNASFAFNAPLEPNTYQLRIDYQDTSVSGTYTLTVN